MANDHGPNFKNKCSDAPGVFSWVERRALCKHTVPSLTGRWENMYPSPNLQCCIQFEISLMEERLSNKDKNIDNPRKSNINTFTQNSGKKKSMTDPSDRKPV